MSNDKVEATFHGANKNRVDTAAIGRLVRRSSSDWEWVAEACDAIADLCAEVDRLRDEVDRVRALIPEWLATGPDDDLRAGTAADEVLAILDGPAPADPDERPRETLDDILDHWEDENYREDDAPADPDEGDDLVFERHPKSTRKGTINWTDPDQADQ